MQSALNYRKDEALTLAEEVMERSSQNLMACYQCRRCAAGCPVADETGISPDILIRKIILGDREGALENKLVWQCVSCYTCGTRCPNQIQTARITETLKKMAKEEHKEPLRPKVKSFHDAFCTAARHFGRVNEIEFMGLYSIKNTLRNLLGFRFKDIYREYMSQALLGLEMTKRRRMHFGLERVRDSRDLRRLYKKAKNKKKQTDKNTG
jgi:heterodisulfide reductase subunit C